MLQHGHLGGIGAASVRELRAVRRCWRCVSFWAACVLVRSSVVRARRLRVRSGLVVIAIRLDCVMSPSVWVGEDARSGGWLCLVAGESVARSAGCCGSWVAGWICVGKVVGELRPVGVGVDWPEAVGV